MYSYIKRGSSCSVIRSHGHGSGGDARSPPARARLQLAAGVMPVGPHAGNYYQPKTVKSKIQNLCCLLEFWQQDCGLLKTPIFLRNVTRTDETVRYVSPGRPRLKRRAGRRLAGGARASYSMRLRSVDFRGRGLQRRLALRAGLSQARLPGLAPPPTRHCTTQHLCTCA